MNLIAVDFDGCLCKHAFPEIGIIEDCHRRVINTIKHRKEVHNDIIILWTCREDRPERAYLTEALEWCKQHDIPIDYANEYPNLDNWPGHGKTIPCRKLFASYYFDDKAVHMGDEHEFH